ncbi:hypothetical protein JSE7799_01602 [Jannaschia seosinensis]|uniref:Uncharacterized protein n=1 Tax=Jannaschia seosinensis TaxID=313367 RepID=A0A0M7BAN4_9RHOB|nr:hypothetical protein JSE7799_01602 [Jannaschia seosinensis]
MIELNGGDGVAPNFLTQSRDLRCSFRANVSFLGQHIRNSADVYPELGRNHVLLLSCKTKKPDSYGFRPSEA